MTAYSYSVEYLNQGTDNLPTSKLADAITAVSAKMGRLIFQPVRRNVNDDNGAQIVDSSGDPIYTWECWFERFS